MRPWNIALLSVVVAALAAGGLAVPWLEVTPRSALAATAISHAPTLAAAALAAYALAALLLTTAAWMSELRRLRGDLARLSDTPDPGRRAAAAIGAETQLRRLAAWLEAADPPTPEAGASTEAAAMPEALRGEAARLYHIWLTRTQFYSALALLAALAVFGAAQDYRPVVDLPSAVPTIWALLAFVGLGLLVLLARFEIDAMVEPLIEALWRSTAGRRAAERAKNARKPAGPAEAALAPAFKELGQRLVSAVDSRRDAALGAAAKLAAATEAATLALRASVENLEASLRAAVERLPGPLAEPPSGFAELEATIARLTAALERFEQSASVSGAADAERPRRAAMDENLARELAQLLRDIEAAG